MAPKAGKAATPAKSVKAVASKAPTKVALKARPAVKKAAPVKAVVKAKTATKPALKKAAPATKRTPAAKGKAVPAKGKPPAKAAAKPASKAVAKSVKKPISAPAKSPAAKTAPVKAISGKTTHPKVRAAVAKPAPSVRPTPAPAAAKPVPVVGKQSPRAAKAASMVPPPPAAVLPSSAAKSSYSPIITPTHIPAAPVNTHKDPKLANHWKTKPLESLTDADIAAMPDSEYMNSVQMAFFRRKLVQLKQDILNNAGETTEHLREDTTVVPDPADRATIEEEHALELRTRDRERKLLKKIEQSISRIDSDDYGYCDETGEPIGVGRLLARPTATLSLEAQQRRELKQKMFGD
ncbi:MAG: RNA polymerase-binding protein DksA [Betaproteobacteria bacterium]|nr:RNA polymerase-binding protein DksA [Betaproteobacteria bacterium]NBY05618.1 RNA polymerase-binding protein DksA [Betaproteobacteria bacterium]